MRRPSFLAAAIVCAAIARAPNARADEPSTTRSWYGWQPMLSDAAALALLVGGASSNDGGGLVLSGAATYVLGAPILHAVHGNADTGALDAVARLALPPVLFLFGYGLFHHASTPSPSSGDLAPNLNFSGIGEGALFAAVGMIGTMVVDYSVASYEAQPLPVTLTAIPVRGGAVIGLSVTR